MSFNRTTVLQSPGYLTLGGGSFFSEAGITVELVMTKEIRAADSFGKLKELLMNKLITVSFTPTQWASLSVLFPYASTVIGASIFGATDSACVITPTNGKPLTLANAAITQMPSINLSASGSQFGECQITGLITNSSSAAALASYLAWGLSGTGAAQTGLDVADIRNAAYTANYNAVDYHSTEGFTIDWDLTLNPIDVDGVGTVDMIFAGLTATATFTPIGIEESAYTDLLGFATGIGAEPTRYDLTIEGPNIGDPSVVLADCQVDPGSVIYSAENNRNGQITFATARGQTTGANDALFTLGSVTA